MYELSGKNINSPIPPHYQSSSGKDLILEYIRSLSVDEQVDGFSVLQCLENEEMDKLKYKRWRNKIYEVYFYKNNRMFYVVSDKCNIYILYCCRKQKNKTEKKDINIITKRVKELENSLDKKFL